MPLPHAPLAEIYDSATSLGRWRRALDAVAHNLEAGAITLRIRRPSETASDLDMLSSTYLEFSRTPGGLYYGLRYSKLQAPDWDYLSRQPVHQPVPDTTLATATDALDKRGDYVFLRKKLGVRRRMGIRLNSDRIWFDAMSIAFPQHLATVPQAAISDIAPLLPHITKAVELGRIFAQLQARYKAALSALDHVRVGLAIALPTGEIIVENAEAQRIFSERDGLWKAANGHLVCHNPDQTAALTSAALDASHTANGAGQAAECLIAVARKSHSEPLLIDVAPLNDSKAEIETNLSGALITIIDPQRVPKIKMNRFVALYELTSAEAQVCALILEGCSVTEIAEHRDTAAATVKNQIAAILQKTGVSRRAALIRLVIRILPPVG